MVQILDYLQKKVVKFIWCGSYEITILSLSTGCRQKIKGVKFPTACVMFLKFFIILFRYRNGFYPQCLAIRFQWSMISEWKIRTSILCRIVCLWQPFSRRQFFYPVCLFTLESLILMPIKHLQDFLDNLRQSWYCGTTVSLWKIQKILLPKINQGIN